MKRNNLQIDSIITKNRLMSIKSLKKELKIEKNTSLIKILLRYFKESIEEIDFSSELKEYEELSRVLNYLKPGTKHEYGIVENLLKDIEVIIEEKKEQLKNEKITFFLDSLKEKINLFLIETKFQIFCNKFEYNNTSSVEESELKVLVDDYVFKYKDYGHLNVLMSIYPKTCNVKSNNKTIVIRMLKHYFTKHQDRQFLAKTITLFISNPNFEISELEQKEILELCEKYSILLGLKDLLFIKEILTSLNIKQELNLADKMSYLKMRYGIQDIETDYFRPSYDNFPIDLTNRQVFTIDCAGTLLRDDAFSIEEKKDGSIELGIYITDVSNVKPKSSMDLYAFNHFSTIYTKDSYIPMMPEPFNLKFSLNQGFKRVMAFTFRFSKKQELIDCEITQAIVNIRKNLSYLDVSEILKNGDELYHILTKALELSEAIGDSIGMIDRYHDIKEVVRELGVSMNEIPEKYLETPGSRIVANMAIFTNNYIANIFDKSGLPFIYRVNDFESTENIHEQLRKYHRDKKMCEIIKSIQTLYKPSTFSSINSGHRGLGLSAYTQATNPARLYPSMMIQRMLTDLFINRISVDEYVKKYQDVEAYAKEFTVMQERNRDFTNEYNKLCKKR